VLAQHGSAGSYFAARQKQWVLLGSAVFFATALVDYRWIRWLGVPVYAASLVLMAMANQVGNEVHQLEVAGLTFQPAQLGITSGILLIAWLVQDLPRLHRWFGAPVSRLVIIGAVSAPPFLLVLMMGDTGSALVWAPVILVALLVGGVPFRYLLFLCLIGIGLVPILYFGVLPAMEQGKRATDRVELWLSMNRGDEVDILGSAWGPHWASVAVGKAGWKGTGWNSSAEKSSVTARGKPSKGTNHTDYIFAVIGEEQGFRGTLFLLLAFAALLVQCLLVAYYSRDICGRLLAALVLTMIFAHVFESVGMCVHLLPVTGIPLPFISYSGTFVIVCMFLMGLVQSVWIHRYDRPMARLAEAGR
jgi:rod shape determining protein RodA